MYLRTLLGTSVFAAALMAVTAAHGQVSFSLGVETPLLDSAFYAGEAADGSDVAGRFVLWGRPSNNGEQVAFIGVNAATFQGALFLVDVGEPTSWRRVTQDRNLLLDPMFWTPDGSAILWGPFLVNLETGEEVPHSVHGFVPEEPSMTRMPTGNWIATEVESVAGGTVYLLPILADGREDLSREPVAIMNTPPEILDPSWPSIAPDGSKMTFSGFEGIPAGQGADISDVWVLDNIDAIRTAGKIPGTDISSAAPTDATDPNLIPIRTDETSNFAHGMNLSENKKLVLYVEDFNNVLNDSDFFNTLFQAEFDIMVSNADGTGSDFRITEAGNQAVPLPFPGGTRFMFFRDVAGRLELFATTLEVSTSVTGTTVGDPIDNTVETTADQMAEDGSGTMIDIPTSTTIDYPDGEAQEISISTPIDPVEEPELPPDVNGVPVVREFGPDGTTFSPAITVTITYTDAEIAGLDEATLRVFRFNEVSGVFDIEVTAGIVRDLANNTISFELTSFSAYGLGGVLDTDGDGIADSTDTDDDNDGIPDGSDPFPVDTDNDGSDNDIDPDDDNDGIPDGDDTVGPLDTDNDGLDNAADNDDDGDGIDDAIEGNIDTDGDGVLNIIDLDSDGDGIDDSVETDSDLDGDTTPNFLDLDSDGDGDSDQLEHELGSDPFDAGVSLPVTSPGLLLILLALALSAAGVTLLNVGKRSMRQ